MSNAVASGGLVYTGWNDDCLRALNATTGTLMWQYTTGDTVWSDPAVSNGVVYFGSFDDCVYALNATNGSLKWIYRTGAWVWSSPTVNGGIVYIGSEDGFAYALNATTGKLVWRFNTGSEVEGHSAIVGSVYPAVVLFESWDSVYALSLTTGAFVAQFETGTPGVSSPAASGAVVFVVSDDTYIYAFNLIPRTWLSVSISPTFAYMNLSQSLTFTSSVSGGTGLYSCQWYLNGSAVPRATSAWWAFTAMSVGSYTVYVKVSDSQYNIAGDKVIVQTATSKTAIVSVSRALAVTISPMSVTLDIGQSLTFNSNVSGDIPPYSYLWWLNGVVVRGATSASWTFTPSSTGSYAVWVMVTDLVSVTATSNNAIVTVSSEPSVIVSPTSATLYVNRSMTFTSAIHGGSSPYAYQWYLNGNSVSGGTSSSWAFTPSSAGSYTVYANVTDRAGYSVESNAACIFVFTTPSVVISPSSAAIYGGQFQQFTSNVTGGIASSFCSYSYQWYLNGSTVSGATNPTWTFTSFSSGFYTVYLEVTDELGTLAKSNTANITVNTYAGQLFHDIGITNITSSKIASLVEVRGRGILFIVGCSLTVNVTLKNEGNYTETFNVTAYGTHVWDGYKFPMYTFTNVTLAPGSTVTLTTTVILNIGDYITLSAYASPVVGETHTSDNTYTSFIVLAGPIVVFSLRACWRAIPI